MWTQKRLKQILDMEKYRNMIGSSKKIVWGRQDTGSAELLAK